MRRFERDPGAERGVCTPMTTEENDDATVAKRKVVARRIGPAETWGRNERVGRNKQGWGEKTRLCFIQFQY